MTEKEIRVRYKFAVLGFLWVVLNPILQMIVIGLIFRFFIPVRVNNYYLFLFSGLLLWNLFSYSVAKCTGAIVFERSLIQKAKFPRENIILSIVLSNVFHTAIALVILMVLLMGDKVLEGYSAGRLFWYGWRLLLVAPALMWTTVLTVGFSLLTSALDVRFRDVNFMVQAGLPLWFYASPVVYSVNLLPPMLQQISYLNPMTAVIELSQYALLGLTPTWLGGWWVGGIMTILILATGIWVFRRESPWFDDWV